MKKEIIIYLVVALMIGLIIGLVLANLSSSNNQVSNNENYKDIGVYIYGKYDGKSTQFVVEQEYSSAGVDERTCINEFLDRNVHYDQYDHGGKYYCKLIAATFSSKYNKQTAICDCYYK